MNILYLVDKKYYTTKMSRIRFRTMESIDNIPGNSCYWFGPGWDNWDNSIDAYGNIKKEYSKIDIVVAYKPLDINGANKLHEHYPICIRYNEMYDVEWTLKEITQMCATLVVCHHWNDWKDYSENHMIPGVTYKYIPHSADDNSFKKWDFDGDELPKIYDVMLVGAIGVQSKLGQHYPLRDRMKTLMTKLPSKYKWGIFNHPSYEHNNAYTNYYSEFFGKALNSTRIAITDSGVPKSRFGKYVEIPACGTAIAADLPETDPDDLELLKQFVIEINMGMTDQEIIDTLVDHLENNNKMNDKINLGLKYAKAFTVNAYAERFIKIITEFLSDA